MPVNPKTGHRNVNKNQGPRPGVRRISKAGIPGPGGAPRLEIDHEMLYAAAETMASFEHLGEMFGCSGNILSHDPEYRGIIDKARAEKKKALLSAQLTAAINDRNPTMLIWLGKQHLHQKDVMRTEHTGADGKPIKTEHTKKVVAYVPDNGRLRTRRPEASEEGEDEASTA